jgi:hypothetical protein
MPENSREVGVAPLYITCDPLSRTFPPGWKDVCFRRMARLDDDGIVRYTCPLCCRSFDHRYIDHLQGDHVWPYSLFGESSWANYQLICGNCNASKSNKLETDVRRVLGDGEFRRMVARFLCQQVETGRLLSDPILLKTLGPAVSNSNSVQT